MKKYLYILLLTFLLSWLFYVILIPALKKWRAGQNILSYVKEHKKKSGTPTMGGLAFVMATVIVSAFFVVKKDILGVLTIIIGLSYMVVGIIDDLLKKRHKENLGLRAWQKFSFQTIVALFVAFFCYRNGLTNQYLPFTKKTVDLGIWTIPLVVFAFLATVNAVNLTDGLDGLAGGVSVPYFFFMATLMLLRGQTDGLICVSFSLIGALLAYLLFNTTPASVFMGDTGSLALGGFASCVACFSGNALYIPIIGLPFVLSVVSVVIQVIYYKLTKGKRVFLMAPIHHHFQQKGYAESKISYAYALTSTLLGIVCTLTVV